MYADYYVYALFRETGVPFYIGLGRNGRMDHHTQRYREQDTHRNRIIRGLMETLGDVPRVKIQERLTKAQAVEAEIALIAAIGREPLGPLVNQTRGGEGVVDISPEARARGAARTSASLMGRKRPQEVIDRITATHRARAEEYYRLNPRPPKPPKTANGGRVWTEEQRRAVSEKRRGFKHTDEARAKMSEKLRGKSLSEEHKRKISEVQRGRINEKTENEIARVEKFNNWRKHNKEAFQEALRRGWERRKERYGSSGKAQPVDPEAKAERYRKISEALKGRKRPKEVIAKITESRRTRALKRSLHDTSCQKNNS